jgi:outer membrane receptor for ferrienterochelin and colicins
LKRQIVAALAVAAASGAHAQQPVPTVVVTAEAGSYDPRRDDTAAKIVVGSAELARFDDASIADALKRVPGITVVSTGRGADVRMRGLGSGYTQILVNGARAPSGFSIDSLAPAQVERVEVIPSATAELSTEAVAGTINIVLKKTVRTAQHQVQLGVGGAVDEHTPRATWLLADRNGGFSWSLSANSRVTWFDRDARIADADTTEASVPVQSSATSSDERGRLAVLNVLPRLSWILANGDTVTWESIVAAEQFQFSAYRQTAATLGPVTDFPRLDWRILTRRVSAKSDLGLQTRLTPATKFEIKAGVQAATGRNDAGRRVGTGAAALSGATDVDTGEQGASTSGKLVTQLADAHQVTAGWEASRIRRTETNDDVGAAGAGVRSVAQLEGTVLRTAAFAQDEWTVGPGWSVYLGARVERIVTAIDANANWRVAAHVWSPVAQTLVRLRQNDQVRLALTRTFKAPDLNSLMPRRRPVEINAATNPDIDGNPLLRPEIASGVDVTYAHYFSKTALVSVGVSSRDIDDYILTLVTREADGRWVGRPVNAGRARVRGLELEARLPLTLLQSAWPAIELRASVSRNWSTVDQVPGPGNRVAQQVPLQATLAADYAYRFWTVGASLILRKGPVPRSPHPSAL